MNKLLGAIFVCFSFLATGQQFADKSYYLVDSLVYDKISPQYQQFINTNLELYHAAKTDMDRITAVNQIVKLCWDDNVWPKYNLWVHDYTTERLKEPQTDSVKNQMLQALAGALYYIGWDYSVKSDYDNCLSYYEQCKSIYEELGDQIGIANSIDNIGSVYIFKGEYAKALEYFVQSLAIREKINDKIGTGASLINMGLLHYGHGDYESAIIEFQRALILHEEAQFVSGVSTALNNLGSMEYYFKNYPKSLEYYTRSLQISEYLGDKQGMASSITHLGTISFALGDPSAALKNFKQSLSLYEEIGDKRGTASSLVDIGFIYNQTGKFKKAIESYDQSLKISTEIGIVYEKRGALHGLFNTYIQQKNYDVAEKYILQIIEIRRNDIRVNFAVLPEQKKELYFSTMSEDFMKLYAFADLRKTENPHITEIAYDNALKLKGLLLKSGTAMREAILESGDKEIIEKYNDWIELKKQIAEQYAKGGDIASNEKQANEIEKELISNFSTFSQLSTNNDLQWKNVQSKLSSQEVAIEFVHFHKEIGNNESSIQYAALIINTESQHPEMITLCSEEELEKILGTTQANNFNYINAIYGKIEERNAHLYNLIWQALEPSLEHAQTVYFSPTGLLHKIAFAALSDQNQELISDKYNLIQMGSTGALGDDRSFEFSGNTTAALFGGVSYSTDKTEHVIWNYLPGTLEEVDSIKTVLQHQIKVSYFQKLEASEENFKQIGPKSNILHIASHGFFYPDPEVIKKEVHEEQTQEDLSFRGGALNYGIWNFVSNQNPLMRSGIALAGANNMWDRGVFEEGEDGILTAQEVATLNLFNTELVVLSACETGLGDIKGDEGVYGLQRAFKMAGVRYIIMSLWQVPDKETAEFMTLFYSNLFVSKDIRQAFAETQKIMREKYDPYFWAAFVLVE